MKILTGGQFKELDKYTVEHEPISPIDLMERASTAITNELVSRWDNQTRFFVFAGPGNNGGDALAVSRMLAQKGYSAEVYLFNVSGKLSEECETNKTRLTMYPNVRLTEVMNQFTFPTIESNDVIIDGLFGTGLNKPLSGGYASVAKSINACKAKVVSIDIPSGLMCEDNTYNNMSCIVRASLTLTIQLPKLAFFFPEIQKYIGELKILNIGLHPAYIQEAESSIETIESKTVSGYLRPRDPFAHKGMMGHALIVGGSFGMAGCTILASRACLRCGAGKITVHTPRMNNDILQVTIPEAILSHDIDDDIITNSISTHEYSSIAIGPGLGDNENTAMALREFLLQASIPVILDADALNILGSHKEWIQDIPQNSILTPHVKELERLIGQCTDSFERLSKARELAIKRQIYIVLKGHFTMICTPTGKTFINTNGNAGMATAGSGDVLCGILAALLAQKYPVEKAVIMGVFLHGLAGDLAAKVLEEECMTASDIITYLPQAFKTLKRI